MLNEHKYVHKIGWSAEKSQKKKQNKNTKEKSIETIYVYGKNEGKTTKKKLTTTENGYKT